MAAAPVVFCQPKLLFGVVDRFLRYRRQTMNGTQSTQSYWHVIALRHAPVPLDWMTWQLGGAWSVILSILYNMQLTLDRTMGPSVAQPK